MSQLYNEYNMIIIWLFRAIILSKQVTINGTFYILISSMNVWHECWTYGLILWLSTPIDVLFNHNLVTLRVQVFIVLVEETKGKILAVQ